MLGGNVEGGKPVNRLLRTHCGRIAVGINWGRSTENSNSSSKPTAPVASSLK